MALDIRKDLYGSLACFVSYFLHPQRHREQEERTIVSASCITPMCRNPTASILREMIGFMHYSCIVELLSWATLKILMVCLPLHAFDQDDSLLRMDFLFTSTPPFYPHCM